jgi:hypothetical protein
VNSFNLIMVLFARWKKAVLPISKTDLKFFQINLSKEKLDNANLTQTYTRCVSVVCARPDVNGSVGG